MKKLLKHLFGSLQDFTTLDFTTLAAFTAIAIFFMLGIGSLIP